LARIIMQLCTHRAVRSTAHRSQCRPIPNLSQEDSQLPDLLLDTSQKRRSAKCFWRTTTNCQTSASNFDETQHKGR
jgi:hypothetical protein